MSPWYPSGPPRHVGNWTRVGPGDSHRELKVDKDGSETVHTPCTLAVALNVDRSKWSKIALSTEYITLNHSYTCNLLSTGMQWYVRYIHVTFTNNIVTHTMAYTR